MDGMGGCYDDSKGYVHVHQLRIRYHEASKSLDKARRNVRECKNVDRLELLNVEAQRCQDVLDEVEQEVKAAGFKSNALPDA
jgi:uncharacterized protein (UPF0335 family)